MVRGVLPEVAAGQVEPDTVLFAHAIQLLQMPLVVMAQMVVFVLFGREQLVLSRQRMLHKE